MANLNTETSKKPNREGSHFNSKVLNGEHQLERVAQSAGKRVGEMASDFANTTADSMRTSREYVKENPVRGIAYAAAAGLVTGTLLTMIMRGRRN